MSPEDIMPGSPAMKIPDLILPRALALEVLQSAFFIFHFSIFNFPAWADDQPVAPTLARLSFYVSPQRMAEFETVYNAKVVPISGLSRSHRDSRHRLFPATEWSVAAPVT